MTVRTGCRGTHRQRSRKRESGPRGLRTAEWCWPLLVRVAKLGEEEGGGRRARGMLPAGVDGARSLAPRARARAIYTPPRSTAVASLYLRRNPPTPPLSLSPPPSTLPRNEKTEKNHPLIALPIKVQATVTIRDDGVKQRILRPTYWTSKCFHVHRGLCSFDNAMR